MLWILCWCQGRPDNQLYGLRTSLPKAKLSEKSHKEEESEDTEEFSILSEKQDNHQPS